MSFLVVLFIWGFLECPQYMGRQPCDFRKQLKRNTPKVNQYSRQTYHLKEMLWKIVSFFKIGKRKPTSIFEKNPLPKNFSLSFAQPFVPTPYYITLWSHTFFTVYHILHLIPILLLIMATFCRPSIVRFYHSLLLPSAVRNLSSIKQIISICWSASIITVFIFSLLLLSVLRFGTNYK